MAGDPLGRTSPPFGREFLQRERKLAEELEGKYEIVQLGRERLIRCRLCGLYLATFLDLSLHMLAWHAGR